MRKFYLYIFMLVATLFVLGSCEKDLDSEGISKITYFPTFTMQGEPEMVVNVGSTYSEPGVTAIENGKNLEIKTTVTADFFGNNGSINTNSPDRYIINYSAINSDGFPGSTERVVYVVNTGDLKTSIEGLYTTTIVRNGVVSAQYQDLGFVMIKKVDGNNYEITDAIGGYYDLGRGYGAGYRASGLIITANNIEAGDFSFTSTEVGTFGGPVVMTSMSVDPATKTISFASEWDSGTTLYVFEVTLTQVQF